MKNQTQQAMDCNVYVNGLRACKISGKWRVLKPDPKRSGDWLFLDEIEYDSASDALAKYI